jgi:hypothetical protein
MAKMVQRLPRKWEGWVKLPSTEKKCDLSNFPFVAHTFA